MFGRNKGKQQQGSKAKAKKADSQLDMDFLNLDENPDDIAVDVSEADLEAEIAAIMAEDGGGHDGDVDAVLADLAAAADAPAPKPKPKPKPRPPPEPQQSASELRAEQVRADEKAARQQDQLEKQTEDLLAAAQSAMEDLTDEDEAPTPAPPNPGAGMPPGKPNMPEQSAPGYTAETAEPAPQKPSASSEVEAEIANLEADIKKTTTEALAFKRAGDTASAVSSMRRLKVLKLRLSMTKGEETTRSQTGRPTTPRSPKAAKSRGQTSPQAGTTLTRTTSKLALSGNAKDDVIAVQTARVNELLTAYKIAGTKAKNAGAVAEAKTILKSALAIQNTFLAPLKAGHPIDLSKLPSPPPQVSYSKTPSTVGKAAVAEAPTPAAAAGPTVSTYPALEAAVRVQARRSLAQAKDARAAGDNKTAAALHREHKHYGEILGLLGQARAKGLPLPAHRLETRAAAATAKVFKSIGPDEMMVEVLSGTNITGTAKPVKSYVTVDHPLDEKAAPLKSRVIKASINPDYDLASKFQVSRKALTRKIERRADRVRIRVHLFLKKSLIGSGVEVGYGDFAIGELMSEPEVTGQVPLKRPNSRQATGAELTMRVRTQTPLNGKSKAAEKTEQFLVFPDLDRLKAALASSATLAVPSADKARNRLSSQSMSAVGPVGDFVIPDKPFAPETLVSNDVLQFEIEAAEAAMDEAEDDVEIFTAKTQLEVAFNALAVEFQTGQLDLPTYCGRLKTAIPKSKMLAKALKEAGRKDEAIRALKHSKIMTAELAEVIANYPELA